MTGETRVPTQQLVAEGFVAYQTGDEQRLREIWHPEIEIHADPGILNGGTFHGWGGFREWVSQWEEAWEQITYEPREIIDLTPDVVVVAVYTNARGRGSGIELSADFFYVFQREGDRVRRFHLYSSREQALAAAQKLLAETE